MLVFVFNSAAQTLANYVGILFKVFFDKIKEAQQEIKSSVTVNTSDISNRDEAKDGLKA